MIDRRIYCDGCRADAPIPRDEVIASIDPPDDNVWVAMSPLLWSMRKHDRQDATLMVKHFCPECVKKIMGHFPPND